jgi:hypothetical protein
MTAAQTSSEMSLTTIKLDSSTRDQLAELGKKNESYDTILKRLIGFWQSNPEAAREWLQGRTIDYLNSTVKIVSTAAPREPKFKE